MTDPEASFGNGPQQTSTNQQRPPGLTDDEWRLVRMYRCMDGAERDDTLIAMCHALMLRYPLWPGEDEEPPDPAQCPRIELSPGDWDSLADCLWGTWPNDWPGRQFVELSHTADPGFWIRAVLADGLDRFLLGSSQHDEGSAEWLSELYLLDEDVQFVHRVAGYEMAWEEMKADATRELIGFLHEWREQVVQGLETLSRGETGPE